MEINQLLSCNIVLQGKIPVDQENIRGIWFSTCISKMIFKIVSPFSFLCTAKKFQNYHLVTVTEMSRQKKNFTEGNSNSRQVKSIPLL